MPNGTVSFTTTMTCTCCTGRVSASLQCRTRGGTAAICGFAEVPGFASTPPKRYRTLTGSGSTDRCTFSTPVATGCLAATGSDLLTFSGTRSYDSSTCVITGPGRQQVYISSGFCPATNLSSTNLLESTFPFTGITGANLSGYSKSESATAQNFSGLGVCFKPSDVPASARATGSWSLSLSAEDTESDAITRLLATSTFPAFATCLTYGTCCKADYEQRTSSVSFSYHEAQYRVIGTVTPSSTYTANIYIYRRPYGTTTYSIYAMDVLSGSSDGAGNYTTTSQDVPNTPGYETYAGPAFIVP